MLFVNAFQGSSDRVLDHCTVPVHQHITDKFTDVHGPVGQVNSSQFWTAPWGR